LLALGAPGYFEPTFFPTFERFEFVRWNGGEAREQNRVVAIALTLQAIARWALASIAPHRNSD
jgi:hypothetical protein